MPVSQPLLKLFNKNVKSKLIWAAFWDDANYILSQIITTSLTFWRIFNENTNTCQRITIEIHNKWKIQIYDYRNMKSKNSGSRNLGQSIAQIISYFKYVVFGFVCFLEGWGGVNKNIFIYIFPNTMVLCHRNKDVEIYSNFSGT